MAKNKMAGMKDGTDTSAGAKMFGRPETNKDMAAVKRVAGGAVDSGKRGMVGTIKGSKA